MSQFSIARNSRGDSLVEGEHAAEPLASGNAAGGRDRIAGEERVDVAQAPDGSQNCLRPSPKPKVRWRLRRAPSSGRVIALSSRAPRSMPRSTPFKTHGQHPGDLERAGLHGVENPTLQFSVAWFRPAGGFERSRTVSSWGDFGKSRLADSDAISWPWVALSPEFRSPSAPRKN